MDQADRDPGSSAEDSLALPGHITASLWRSLGWFSAYRLVVAGLFLGIFEVTRGAASLGAQDGPLFRVVAEAYIVLAALMAFGLWRIRRAFNVQLVFQVCIDIAALTTLMYASGGYKSGIVVMVMVVIAGAGLVGQGRLTFLFAALATIGVLTEQQMRSVFFGAESQEFVRAGLISTGFFAIAAIARLLGHRTVANELLAYRRGVELDEQVRVNRQVIEDMDDGVLVVTDADRVRLHNRQAEALLGVSVADDAPLAVWSATLAEYLRRHRDDADVTERLHLAGGDVQARLVSLSDGGNTLIYLQDFGRIQAEARQIKLAALGRLTANIAHEIRNPLSAISHASELLVDEQRADTRARLVRIIRDNSARLNRLVAEVLELGRRDQAVAELIRIDAFLGQFHEERAFQDPAARRRLLITGSPDAALLFDRTHLHRVIENLVSNAMRYASQADGAIRVDARLIDEATVELHIQDDGPGISAADRAKVFEPFFTTSSAGTGLGLYIARELCEANQASLELIDSGGGAHFRIRARGQTWPSSTNVGSVTT